MKYTTSASQTRRAVGMLIGAVVATGTVVLALAQMGDAQTTAPGPGHTPVPSSPASMAPHAAQRTHPARPAPAPSPMLSPLGGFASPSRCIQANGGDWNACNVGNSGRGDLPYRVVARAGRR
jgi:hypothetical protein